MKKLLLFLLIAVSVGCDKEDPKPEEAVKPKVESVEFFKANSGGTTRIAIRLKLIIPESGDIKSVSMIRGTTRINNIIQSEAVNGINIIYDNGAEWPNGEAYYSFILILKDNTEIVSGKFKVVES